MESDDGGGENLHGHDIEYINLYGLGVANLASSKLTRNSQASAIKARRFRVRTWGKSADAVVDVARRW